MTWLRRCYKCKARFYENDPTEYDKIWYWALPGAALFDQYSVHGPQVMMDRQVDLANWQYPGELPGFEIYPGITPLGLPGNPGCQIGEDSWFITGVPDGLTRADVPVPECCQTPLNPNFAFRVFGTFATPTGSTIYTDTAANRLLLWFLALTGPTTTPPATPPGWLEVYYQTGPNANTAVQVLVHHCSDSSPVPFAWNLGSATFATACEMYIDDTATGITEIADDDYVAASAFESPELFSPGPTSLAVVVALSVLALGVIVTEPDDTVSIGGTSAGSCRMNLAYQDDLPPGPAGPWEWTATSPLDVKTFSMLVR